MTAESPTDRGWQGRIFDLAPALYRGAQVTAVEPGAALSELLVQRSAGCPLRVVTATSLILPGRVHPGWQLSQGKGGWPMPCTDALHRGASDGVFPGAIRYNSRSHEVASDSLRSRDGK